MKVVVDDIVDTVVDGVQRDAGTPVRAQMRWRGR